MEILVKTKGLPAPVKSLKIQLTLSQDAPRKKGHKTCN